MTKPRLVVCRVGDHSLHREWVGDPATRSYDVWLDYWGDRDESDTANGAVWSVGRGTTKWPRMASLLAERADAARSYRSVWFPDDDLRATPEVVDRLFEIFERLELWLAQPALTAGSFLTFCPTLANGSFLARFTNFAEVMAPIFSAYSLTKCTPTFSQSRSGWGLDVVWPRLLGLPRDRIAIIDAAPVTHTRPVMSGDWYRRLGSPGNEEYEALALAYGVPLPYRLRQYGGVLRRGEKVCRAGFAFAAKLALGSPPSVLLRRSYWLSQLRSLCAGRQSAGAR
jgi:hypothetical protein